ncbi:MAG: hypothetical protein DRN83_00300 [Hadesarchaea archaeon]|nr:MAG: hypothetical protein DRN83_00300 [Hadesarchaea archaeon]
MFLNPAKYHLKLLERGEIRDFQLVKRCKKYYAHIVVQYEVEDRPVHAVLGVDLGIRRSAATVLLRPDRPLKREDFSVIRDGPKRQLLNWLNERAAELRRAKKWKALKRIQGKRRRIAEYFDRLTAKRIADISGNCLVVIGYPKWVRANNYRGNGKRWLRRKLTGWSYGRIIRYIREECAEKGIKAIESDERWSSMICHRCGSRNTERPIQSIIRCYSCGLIYNADFNAAVNIGSSFSAGPWSRGVQLNHPELRVIRPERSGSAEAAGL